MHPLLVMSLLEWQGSKATGAEVDGGEKVDIQGRLNYPPAPGRALIRSRKGHHVYLPISAFLQREKEKS